MVLLVRRMDRHSVSVAKATSTNPGVKGDPPTLDCQETKRNSIQFEEETLLRMRISCAIKSYTYFYRFYYHRNQTRVDTT